VSSILTEYAPLLLSSLFLSFGVDTGTMTALVRAYARIHSLAGLRW
jgi:hypothetical protein